MSEGVEWDEHKRLENIKERGVDFLISAAIFEDVFLEAIDDRQDYGEDRYRASGHVNDQHYLVAYTWRGENRRIISAWKVGEDGRRRYQALLAGPAAADESAR